MSGRARSVGEQHGDHETDADRNDWVLGEPYADNDISASRYTSKIRGEWTELIGDLEAGAFDAHVLILWESSRGSRRVGEWVELLDLCERREVRIWVHTHQTLYDPSNPRHRRALLEDAVDSEYESGKVSLRVRRARQAAAAAGLPHGRLLYGYRRVYDERGRYVRQEPHPEQAPTVRELAERVDAGESLYAIERDLKGRWDHTRIRRVVTNPAYAGLRLHQGEVIGKADWPAILPMELWQRCVARFADPRRKTVRDAKLRHLLSGTLRCGVCDTPVRVYWHSRQASYGCERGFCVSIKQVWADEFVAELVLQRMEREDALELLQPAEAGERRARAERELAELEQDLAEFYELAKARKLSARALAEVEADRLPRIERLRGEAQPAAVPPALRRLAVNPRETWAGDDFTIGMQREVVAELLEVRLLKAARPGQRQFDPGRVEWVWRQF